MLLLLLLQAAVSLLLCWLKERLHARFGSVLVERRGTSTVEDFSWEMTVVGSGLLLCDDWDGWKGKGKGMVVVVDL